MLSSFLFYSNMQVALLDFILINQNKTLCWYNYFVMLLIDGINGR